MDKLFLKACGVEAVKDIALHVLDRACLLLFAFAFGMLAYTLMYGTGALYILILCAMVMTGIVAGRYFLHSAMVHVRYLLVLYLKKELQYEETYSMEQLDKVSHLCEVLLTALFVGCMLPWCGILMVVITALVIVLNNLSEGKHKDEVMKHALHNSIYTAAYCILFVIAVLFIRQQEISADSALSVLLALSLSFPAVSLKQNVFGLLYGLSLLLPFAVSAVVVLEMFQLIQVPMVYESALLCFLCIGSACFVAGMHIWKTNGKRSYVAMLLAVIVILVLLKSVFALCMGVFLMLVRLLLLPAMSASLSRGFEEWEEDDDADIYAMLVRQSDAGGTFAGMFCVSLFVAGMTLLYLRGMVTYNLMLCGMMVMIGYMLSPVVSMFAKTIKEMMMHHLHRD